MCGLTNQHPEPCVNVCIISNQELSVWTRNTQSQIKEEPGGDTLFDDGVLYTEHTDSLNAGLSVRSQILKCSDLLPGVIILN